MILVSMSLCWVLIQCVQSVRQFWVMWDKRFLSNIRLLSIVLWWSKVCYLLVIQTLTPQKKCIKSLPACPSNLLFMNPFTTLFPQCLIFHFNSNPSIASDLSITILNVCSDLKEIHAHFSYICECFVRCVHAPLYSLLSFKLCLYSKAFVDILMNTMV